MWSEETQTTIVFNHDNGTVLSKEDGVFYSAEEVLKLQDRKKLTGKGITMEEHQVKLADKINGEASISNVLEVFRGEIVEYPTRKNRNGNSSRNSQRSKVLGMDSLQDERREERGNPSPPEGHTGSVGPTQGTFNMD